MGTVAKIAITIGVMETSVIVTKIVITIGVMETSVITTMIVISVTATKIVIMTMIMISVTATKIATTTSAIMIVVDSTKTHRVAHTHLANGTIVVKTMVNRDEASSAGFFRELELHVFWEEQMFPFILVRISFIA